MENLQPAWTETDVGSLREDFEKFGRGASDVWDVFGRFGGWHALEVFGSLFDGGKPDRSDKAQSSL